MNQDTQSDEPGPWYEWRPGKRVVVRFLDGEQATDALGVVTKRTDAHLGVNTRRGEVNVPLADIILGHEVPPPPTRAGPTHRTVSCTDLEVLLAEAWWPPVTRWLNRSNLSDTTDEPIEGGWLLRAAGGHTKRANSALALGSADMADEQVLDAVKLWYAERDQQPMVCLYAPPSSTHPARKGLEREGWSRFAPSYVLSAASGEVAGLAREAIMTLPGARDHRVEVAERPDERFYRGLGYPDRADRPESLEGLLTSANTQYFAVAGDDDVSGVARMAISRKWAVLTDIAVGSAHRRKGVARFMIGMLAARAQQQGIRTMALQVDADNTAALDLYDKLGFAVHHHYAYWRP